MACLRARAEPEIFMVFKLLTKSLLTCLILPTCDNIKFIRGHVRKGENGMFRRTYRKMFSFFLSYSFLAAMMTVPFSISAEDSIDVIKAGLGSRDWKVRLAAVGKLDERKDEEALNMLRAVAATRSEYWPVKIRAILLLGKAHDQKAVGVLLSIFNDPFYNWECPSIKSYTAVALGNFKGNPKVVDTLIRGAQDRELLTREASIRSLGKIGDPKAVPCLLRLLVDRSMAVRLSAIKALAEIGDPIVIPRLQRVAENDRDSVVKSEAMSALNTFHWIDGNN
jgi:HEAT repeat protein